LAARPVQRRAGLSDPGTDARVSRLVAKHERSLMRVAHHWSLCSDDAFDAYQRAMEIYVRRVDTLDPATEIAWMKVVVKHESLAVRRARTESLPVEEVDFDGHASESQRPVDDLLAGRERVRRSAEALRRLKPDEARALLLKGEGLSYAEIGERLSWSLTKVNRCLTEGRARFLKVYAEIEAGAECDRFAPTLAALVGGTASAAALLELRPHIRNCATCRATVRELHATRLGRLASLLPIPALIAPLRWAAERISGAGRDRDAGLELSPVAGDLYDAIAPLDPSAAQNHPRGVEWAVQRAGDGVASLKQHAVARALDPTPLAGVRPGAAAAAVAGCLAIGGGTTFCVTQGVDPIGGLAQVVAPMRDAKPSEPSKKRKRASAVPASTPAPTPVAVAPTVEPLRSSPQPPVAQATPRPTPEPTPPPRPEEEYEPLVPAVAASTAPSPSVTSPRTPAPAPAQGPGEFDGP